MSRVMSDLSDGNLAYRPQLFVFADQLNTRITLVTSDLASGDFFFAHQLLNY